MTWTDITMPVKTQAAHTSGQQYGRIDPGRELILEKVPLHRQFANLAM